MSSPNWCISTLLGTSSRFFLLIGSGARVLFLTSAYGRCSMYPGKTIGHRVRFNDGETEHTASYNGPRPSLSPSISSFRSSLKLMLAIRLALALTRGIGQGMLVSTWKSGVIISGVTGNGLVKR